MKNLMRCETCGLNVHEVNTAIFEKPLRFAFRSDIKVMEQVTNDNREQENICLECFTKELLENSRDCYTRQTVTFK